MKRLLCLCLLLLATPATGAVRTYHVGSGGSNANTGVTYAQRWATIAFANSQVNTSILGTDYDILVKLYAADSTGSTVYDFDVLPNPVNAATGGKRYFFRPAKLHGPIPWGTPNVRVPGGTLSGNYVSLRGLWVSTALYITGNRDSVVGCVSEGSLYLRNADYDVINGNRFSGPHCWINGNEAPGETRGTELSDNHFTNIYTNGGWACSTPGIAAGTHGFWTEHYTDSCFFLRNRFNIKNDASSVANAPVKIKFTKNSIFRGNRFDIEIGAVCGNEWNWWIVYRDSCIANVFRADTFFVNHLVTSQSLRGVIPGAGNYTASCRDLTIDSCFFKVNRGNLIDVADEVKQWTVTNSIFFNEDGRALHGQAGFQGPNRFENNTFVGNVPMCWCPSDEGTPCGCRMNDDAAGANAALSFTVDTTKFISNIFVNTTPGHHIAFTIPKYMYDRPYAMLYVTPSTLLKSQWNCFYTTAYFDSAGDGSIGWTPLGQSPESSAPGKYGRFKASFPTATSDSFSVDGDPYLAGMPARHLTYANFEPWLAAFSPCRAAGKSGVSAGAVQYVEIPFVEFSTDHISFAPTEDNGWTRTETIIISNITPGTQNLSLSGLSVTVGSEYLAAYLTKSTIAPADTAGLVVTVTNGPTSGVGRWNVRLLTNDTARDTVNVPVDFRESRSRGGLDPTTEP